MAEVKDLPAVQDMLQKAESILGYDILIDEKLKPGAAGALAAAAGVSRTRRCHIVRRVASVGGAAALCDQVEQEGVALLLIVLACYGRHGQLPQLGAVLQSNWSTISDQRSSIISGYHGIPG